MVELEISVMTDEFDRDLRKVCEFLAKEDVRYVELRNVYKENVLKMSEEMLGNVKDILNEFDMKVSSISGGLLKYYPKENLPRKVDDSKGEGWEFVDSKTEKLFKNALIVATELKAPYIRIFGYAGSFSVPPVSQWDNWEIYNKWSKTVEVLKKIVAEKGKMLICENDAGFNKSLEQIERIGKDHCGPGFGMLLDTANSITSYKEKGILTEEWLKRIGKYTQFVHAKGAKKVWGLFYKTSYINGPKDVVGWPRLIKFFREMDPGDFIQPAPEPLFLSIETHFGKPPRWPYSVQNLKNLKSLLGK